MELLNFINSNENWKELIQEKPYCITVKEDEKYILLSYSQIESDFSLQLVQECRGIIFRKSDLKIVCYPFDKFFNVQEGHASKIDWSSARVQEKLDGSIIKVWYDDDWHISTNGTINANNAELQNSLSEYKNYAELFLSVFPQELLFNTLGVNCTYIFELVSPFNRIVVPYSKTDIYHIGTRSNITLIEVNQDIGIKKPREYNLHSLEDCITATQYMPFSEEGFVVVDKYFQRVKIKSPAYVSAHHLRGEGTLNNKRIVEMIMANGQDDFLSIYPEYIEAFENVNVSIARFAGAVINDMKDIPINVSRKEYALWAKETTCPPFMFALLDKWDNVNTPLDWLFMQQTDKIMKWIGLV